MAPKLPGPQTVNVAPVENEYRAQGYRGGIAEQGQLDAAEINARSGAKLFGFGEHLADEQDQLNYAQSVQSFINKKLAIDQAAETDPDYATLPDRYQKQLTQAAQESGTGINSPLMRARFQDGMSRYVEYGTNSIIRSSHAKALDADRGWLRDFVDGGIKTALTSGSDLDRENTFQSVNTAINVMATKGSISAVDAANLRKSVPETYAARRATMLMDSDPGAAEKILAPEGVSADGTPQFEAADDWRKFLEPAKRMDLYRMAQQRAREKDTASFIDQQRREAIDRKAKDDAAETTANGFVSQLIKAQTPGTGVQYPDPLAIANDPHLKPAQKEGLFNATKAAISAMNDGKDTKTYGNGFYDAYQAIHLPADDPRRITDATQLYGRVGPHKDPATGQQVPGDLTVAGVDKLTQEIMGRRTPEGEAEATMKRAFLTMAHNEITGTDEGLHLKDPRGDQLYLKFLAYALPAYEKARRDGKSAPELLGEDSDIFKAVKTYKRPINEWTRDMLNANAPGAETSTGIDLTSQAGIVTAYHNGKISRDDASAALIKGGFASAPSPAAAPVAAEPAPAAPAVPIR